MERSSRNFQPSSSKRKFQAKFASLNRYFTENSRWVPLTSMQTLCYGIESAHIRESIIMHVHTLCEWFSSSASASDSDYIWFALDHKRNVGDGVVSGIGTLFSLDHKLPITTPTPSIVKTSLKSHVGKYRESQISSKNSNVG